MTNEHPAFFGEDADAGNHPGTIPAEHMAAVANILRPDLVEESLLQAFTLRGEPSDKVILHTGCGKPVH